MVKHTSSYSPSFLKFIFSLFLKIIFILFLKIDSYQLNTSLGENVINEVMGAKVKKDSKDCT